MLQHSHTRPSPPPLPHSVLNVQSLIAIIGNLSLSLTLSWGKKNTLGRVLGSVVGGGERIKCSCTSDRDSAPSWLSCCRVQKAGDRVSFREDYSLYYTQREQQNNHLYSLYYCYEKELSIIAY